ncbi:hypothetical protein GX48_05509 [Paracoccidioides brasiliensis]|nr:hypothetical protein GX48_05509 [Paracoccidioides brasiliensis]
MNSLQLYLQLHLPSRPPPCRRSHSPSNGDKIEYPKFLDFSKVQKPRHHWDGSQREIVCVARRFYSLTLKQETAIFNYMFASDLQKEGFLSGLPVTTLNSQCHDMVRNKHPIWVSVNSSPHSHGGDDEYREARRLIEMVCIELGIEISKKPNTYPQVKGCQLLKSFFNIPDAKKADELMLEQTFETETEAELNTEPQHERTPSTNLNSRRRTLHKKPFKGKKPRIVYRFHNAQSRGINSPSIRAAVWATGPSHIQHPSLLDQRILANLAKSHLSRYTIPSPFISTYATLLPTIHRMLTKSNCSMVSIIDASKLNQQMLFSAQELLEKDPLGPEITKVGYLGWQEWLVWGSISEEAIICTISHLQLLNIVDLNPDIESVLQTQTIKLYVHNRLPLKTKLRACHTKVDAPHGKVIGRFLRMVNLPLEYIEDVALGITRGWLFTRSHTNTNDEFLGGVRQGYTECSAYVTPPITPQKPEKQPEIIVIDDELSKGGVTLDRFQEELRRTAETEPESESETPEVQHSERGSQWETVYVEMNEGNENFARVFELDRERVNRVMGWENENDESRSCERMW